MFWIDKKNSKFRKTGHSIVNSFIKKAWNDNCHRYIGCNYREFKRDNRMEQLLLHEQKGYCCYCMRHLEGGTHTTLEHVMPHHCRKQDGSTDWSKVNYYRHFNRTFDQKVAYIHLDSSEREWCSGPPYPHFCAYENLTVSCDGCLYTDEERRNNIYPSQLHKCCNNPRGDKKIIPLFFIKNIGKLVVYDGEDGSITFNTKSTIYQIELSNAVDALKLDNPRLQVIRRAWHRIALSQYSINDVMSAKGDSNLRDEIIFDSGIKFEDSKHIKQQLYWELLSEYHWFYHYFKHHHSQ